MSEPDSNTQKQEHAPATDKPETFLTGVDIDVDQWRAQTVEELTSWLEDIKSRKTEFGDPLVDFPQNWGKEQNLSQSEQLDMISSGISKQLSGNEAKDAQSDIQSIRAQAEKLSKLDKILSTMKSSSSDEEEELPKEDEDLLEKEIAIPKIDTSGPNPFDLSPEALSRIKEIDSKLGIQAQSESSGGPKQTKTMAEINDELLKLYKDEPQQTEQDKPVDTQKKPEMPKQPRPPSK